MQEEKQKEYVEGSRGRGRSCFWHRNTSCTCDTTCCFSVRETAWVFRQHMQLQLWVVNVAIGVELVKYVALCIPDVLSMRWCCAMMLADAECVMTVGVEKLGRFAGHGLESCLQTSCFGAGDPALVCTRSKVIRRPETLVVRQHHKLVYRAGIYG